ncbi:MAG: hypothetical protein K2M11_00215 [Paramuribaculum sp.]|nr:hypothetical protein [Paramuribaculum sp.]
MKRLLLLASAAIEPVKRKRLIFYLIAVIIVCGQIDAKDLIVSVSAKKEFTGEAIRDFKGWLVTSHGNDTIHGKLKTSYIRNGIGMTIMTTQLTFSVPNEDAEYILTAQSPDYEDITRTVTIKKRSNRDINIELDNLVFQRQGKELGEVVVRASKVKFYAKGDTMVYNADAFVLPEGTMLDALVKQLPGVEIRDGGEIYVNGKYVESLLLNGSDFFNSNKQLMLNNLASYTVKNVSVYDKISEKSKLAGRNLGDSQYVMDVTLKRDYMSGFVGNIEAGAGTASRYLGRMFGMWYTSRSRLALIANVNNLNDSRQPGQNDQYTATNNPGDFRTKMAGLSYNVKSVNPDNEWDFSGTTTVSHVRNNYRAVINQTNYLIDGDTYENSFDKALSHNLTVNSSNTLQLRPKNKYIGITNKFNYSNRNQTGRSMSAAFNSELTDLTLKMLEAIYSGETTSFADITLNSTLTQSFLSDNSMSVSGGVQFDTKVPSTPDLFSSSVSLDYDRSNTFGFDRYDINYNRENTRSAFYSYTRNHPNHDFNFKTGFSYTFIPSGELSMLLSCYYFHKSSTKDSYFYRLDRLSDAGIFGSLPADYQSALDNGQSHMSTMRSHDAYMQFNLTYNKKFASGGELMLTVKPVVEYLWRSLDYRQADNNQYIKDNSFKLWFYSTFINYTKGKNILQLKFDRNVKLVPLDRLVTITDTRDPLNIYFGAKNLKNSSQNDFTLGWTHNSFQRHTWSNYLSLAYSFTQDALATAYSFNSQTGVRTYMMQNVNGNWYARLHEQFYKAFGTIDQFDIITTSRITYGHNADLTATDSEYFTKSIIKNLVLSEDLRMNWRLGKHSIGLRALVEWRDTRGNRKGFNDFSATTAQYGINGNFVLPYNFSIATDLNLYTRRGYAYSELNTTDVVWNARLSYAPKNGRWVFMLDGFDLLHQLSNVTYNVNAQGRTETWTNVLPRYGLLHVQYKFAGQPKRKI